MPDNEKKITKLDEDDLSAVAGGRGRTLFVSCSRFNVITPSGECLWK